MNFVVKYQASNGNLEFSTTKARHYLERQAKVMDLSCVYEPIAFDFQEVSRLFLHVSLHDFVREEYVVPNYCMTLALGAYKNLCNKRGYSILQSYDVEELTSACYTNMLTLSLNTDEAYFDSFIEFHEHMLIMVGKVLNRLTYARHRNSVRHVEINEGAFYEVHHNDMDFDYTVKEDNGDDASWGFVSVDKIERAHEAKYQVITKTNLANERARLAIEKAIEVEAEALAKAMSKSELAISKALAKIDEKLYLMIEEAFELDGAMTFLDLLSRKASVNPLTGTERSTLSRMTTELRTYYNLEKKEELKAKRQEAKAKTEEAKEAKRLIAKDRLAKGINGLSNKLDLYLASNKGGECLSWLHAKNQLQKVTNNIELDTVRHYVKEHELIAKGVTTERNKYNQELSKRLTKGIAI